MAYKEIIHVEPCKCEFTEFISEDSENSFCTLTKCKCKKHYEEQFKASWYDEEGYHEETFEPSSIVPLEMN